MNDTHTHPTSRRRLRTSLLAVVAAAAMVAATLATTGTAGAATLYCLNHTGTNGGYYYQMWTAGTGSACVSLKSSTSYSTTWSGLGNFVAGVGWPTGSKSRAVNFSASLSVSSGSGLVSLYGWTTSPLIEYYVMENYNGSAPVSSGTYLGQVTSDGGTYKIYKHQQVNQPSIQGTATFWQYEAVRQTKRSSGTITFANFVSAWSKYGLTLGTMNYQMVATEGYGGSGNSSVSIS
jgi:endo-1,4-beta-xylanase